MFSERYISQIEPGVYRRYFSENPADSEFMVWLDLPVDKDKNGRLRAFEFSLGEHLWRKGMKDPVPSFYPKSRLFALAGKGVDAWEKLPEVPDSVVERFRAKLTELSQFLVSAGIPNLAPPMPLDSSLRSE